MEANFSQENGMYINKETYGDLITNYKEKLVIREKLPPTTPEHLKNHPRVLKLFRFISNDIILVARGLRSLFNVDLKFKDIRLIEQKYIEEIAEHQKIVIKNVLKKKFNIKVNYDKRLCDYDNGNNYGECLLQLDTGLGKTRVGCAIIGILAAISLVIVPTKHIAHQWIDELNKCIPEYKVCLYTNPKDQSTEDYDVMIIVINTAMKKDTSFFSNYSLIIIDEVHECTSTKKKNVL